MDKNSIKLLETGKHLEFQEQLLESLEKKVLFLLEEKKKEVTAKSFLKKELEEGGDEKAIFDAQKRKTFRQKMLTLNKVV